jgi:hypothetical protein
MTRAQSRLRPFDAFWGCGVLWRASRALPAGLIVDVGPDGDEGPGRQAVGADDALAHDPLQACARGARERILPLERGAALGASTSSGVPAYRLRTSGARGFF